MSEGWIKLHRQFLNWEWYSNANVKILFLHFLLLANHDEKSWQGIKIKAGQFITSIENLSSQTGLTKQKVRTAIEKLKLTNEITHETTSKYSMITLKNWDKYQTNNTQDNKQITNEQQTNNKQITTNKNDKNDKNDKNIFLEKKVDPFFNSVKEVYINQYEKIMGKKPYLTLNECNKLLELDESIENFAQTIPTAIERLKKIKFKDIDFIPSSSWLLKENNYTKILNGEFEKNEDKTSHLQAVLERMRARNNG